MSNRDMLRNTNLRWIGFPIFGLGVAAGFLIDSAQHPVLAYAVPIVFCLWGLRWLSRPSRHSLWMEGADLHWQTREGPSESAGSMAIDRIKRVELRKKGDKYGSGMQWVEVVLIPTDGQAEVPLPRNIHFGGTGNPRVNDVVTKLRTIKPSIEFETHDQRQSRR